MGKVIITLGGAVGIDPDECTAGRPQVLSGYTAGVHGEDDPVPGSMPERGTWNGSVPMNGSVTIPDGHHSGSGKVNGPAVTNRGAWAGSVGMNTQITIPEGYHNGAGKVSGPSVSVRGAGTKAVSGGFNNEGLFYYIPKGYWNPDNSGNSWTYLTRQEVANIIGLNGGNIRSGVNYCGVQGSMVDYSYLAVNHVPFDGASFSGVLAEGAEICNTNPNNSVERNPVEFTQYGIRLSTSKTYRVYPTFCPKHSINFAPFRTVRVTACFSGSRKGAGYFTMSVWDINQSKLNILTDYGATLTQKTVGLPYALSAKYTGDMDVSKVGGEGFLTINFTNDENLTWSNYFISRIEFFTL